MVRARGWDSSFLRRWRRGRREDGGTKPPPPPPQRGRRAAPPPPTLLSAFVALFHAEEEEEEKGSAEAGKRPIDASTLCDLVCTELAGDAEEEAGTAFTCFVDLLLAQDPAFDALFRVHVTARARVDRLAPSQQGTSREHAAPSASEWAGDLASRTCTAVRLPALSSLPAQADLAGPSSARDAFSRSGEEGGGEGKEEGAAAAATTVPSLLAELARPKVQPGSAGLSRFSNAILSADPSKAYAFLLAAREGGGGRAADREPLRRGVDAVLAEWEGSDAAQCLSLVARQPALLAHAEEGADPASASMAAVPRRFCCVVQERISPVGPYLFLVCTAPGSRLHKLSLPLRTPSTYRLVACASKAVGSERRACFLKTKTGEGRDGWTFASAEKVLATDRVGKQPDAPEIRWSPFLLVYSSLSPSAALLAYPLRPVASPSSSSSGAAACVARIFLSLPELRESMRPAVAVAGRSGVRR